MNRRSDRAILASAAHHNTGATFAGTAAFARLTHRERIVVDEAGMLDQDTAFALLTIADAAGPRRFTTAGTPRWRQQYAVWGSDS